MSSESAKDPSVTGVSVWSAGSGRSGVSASAESDGTSVDGSLTGLLLIAGVAAAGVCVCLVCSLWLMTTRAASSRSNIGSRMHNVRWIRRIGRRFLDFFRSEGCLRVDDVCIMGTLSL